MEEVKKIVIPGEMLTNERKKLGANVFQRNGCIYSSVLGIAKITDTDVNVVPLVGKYMPKKNDIIIGIIKDENFAGYIIDINSFYYSFLPKKVVEMMSLKKGAVIQATISEVNEIRQVEIEDIRPLFAGELIDVLPVKVPRIIGRHGSMLKLLKEKTGCNIIVGQNGRIWIKNGDLKLCIEAIEKIENKAHLSNLTQRIEAFLNEKTKGSIKEKGDL